jgi:hypothetical protein
VAYLGRKPGEPVNSEIAYGLWVMSLDDGARQFLTPGALYPSGWSGDSESIYAQAYGADGKQLVKVPVRGGNVEEICLLPDEVNHRYCDISPDGSLFAYAIVKEESDVWAVENFDPDLAQ